jgi:hypothetical protein
MLTYFNISIIRAEEVRTNPEPLLSLRFAPRARRLASIHRESEKAHSRKLGFRPFYFLSTMVGKASDS